MWNIQHLPVQGQRAGAPTEKSSKYNPAKALSN